ncbi:hotdog family protein [Seonamhaeicola marinus]|uniref:3-hydroxyacyl-ACP dehydratase n=1 Tax=Seonamhaeicola marinus TaxID=1912246 RepID=A0A5D0HRH2_9FLAO|nr:3-hydroxyacyl-ACP dehydratase [Seonamhaeicola marinus]TYA73963.1 3-hydroxyacyl-ACP dehydratase [Seonamhaeicola marinus]
MLLKEFYKTNSIESVDNKISANVTINKDHEVFKGHFPGNPVTPGVCMMQIIKEITEDVTGKSLFMSSVNNVKFMAIINPEENPDLNIEIDINETESGFKIKNTTSFQDTIALKLSANYITK